MRRSAAIAAAALLAASAPATAALKSFSWVAPDQYENGDALPLEELERYELGCGPQAGDRSTDVHTWLASESSSGRGIDFAVGEWHCALRVRAVRNGETSPYSEWSNEVTFTVAPSSPNAPTNLSVTDAE